MSIMPVRRLLSQELVEVVFEHNCQSKLVTLLVSIERAQFTSMWARELEGGLCAVSYVIFGWYITKKIFHRVILEVKKNE